MYEKLVLEHPASALIAVPAKSTDITCYHKCNIKSEYMPQAVAGEHSYSYVRQHKLNCTRKCWKGTTTQPLPWKHGIPYLISTENNRNNNVAGDDKALYRTTSRHDLVTNVSPARNFPCMCYESTFFDCWFVYFTYVYDLIGE
jgi:hypothetical protein